jgi:hypothetical protein
VNNVVQGHGLRLRRIFSYRSLPTRICHDTLWIIFEDRSQFLPSILHQVSIAVTVDFPYSWFALFSLSSVFRFVVSSPILIIVSNSLIIASRWCHSQIIVCLVIILNTSSRYWNDFTFVNFTLLKNLFISSMPWAIANRSNIG